LVADPSGMTDKTNDETNTARFIRVRRDEQGYSVEGPGFYAWDEDLDAVLSAASDLSLGRFPAARVRRALLVPPPRAQRRARHPETKRRRLDLRLEV